MRTLTIAFVLSLASAAQAQTPGRLKDPVAARQLSDRIMAKVAAGDIEAGLKLAKPYVIIPDAELDAMIGQAKLQVPAMALRFGKSVGYEFIREDRAGEALLRIVQINKFEKHITRWNFYFYRTPTGWVLNTFNFDDNLRALFPGAG